MQSTKMKFQDEHDEEQEEGITIPPQPGYKSAAPSSSSGLSLNPPQAHFGDNTNTEESPTGGGGAAAARLGGGKSGAPSDSSMVMIRYKECMKNHAAMTGGNVVDGCGEFMPASEEGTVYALKCDACGCHRSFHRKVEGGELSGAPVGDGVVLGGGDGGALHPRFSSNYCHTARASPLTHVVRPGFLPLATPMTAPAPAQRQHHQHYRPSLPSTPSGARVRAGMDDLPNPNGGSGGSGSKKRFRTKFSQEQKNKMLAFAETLGWRIQRPDHDEVVNKFCADINVSRKVFKVWMHNHKSILGNRPLN